VLQEDTFRAALLADFSTACFEERTWAMIHISIAGPLFTFIVALGVAAAQVVPAPVQSGTVFKTSSELVVLDVVATDPHRDPIHHLAVSDFTILEDGKPQTIKVFEEHANGAYPQKAAELMPKLQPGRYTNFTPAPASGSANILLLDMLNTPYNAQAIVRSQALKFLDDMRPGTQLAIFSLSDRLKLVQGFTADPTILRVQLESAKANPVRARQLVNVTRREEMEADGPDTLPDGNNTTGASGDAALAFIDAASKQSLAELAADQVKRRAQITLAAMNQLARYLNNIPGRKNLIWLSGSFPITILPDPSVAPIDPFAIEVSTGDEFKNTVDLMALSRVAVYPVSAFGLAMPIFRSDRGGPPPTSALPQFVNKLADIDAPMYQMAEATGGKAYLNTNGLGEAAEDAIRHGSNYYTIAYTPTNPTLKGDYRKIEVKLDKPKVVLDYRRGYYAEDALKSARPISQGPGASPSGSQYSAMLSAMVHGSPQPTQIIMVTDVRPSVPGTEPAAAPGNQPAKGVSGPFRRYTATFVTTPGEMNCAASHDGLHHCAMDFLTVVFDADGTRVNMQTSALSFDVPADRFAWLQTQSFSYSQQISVPVKGEYFLRMGMRDATNDRVGAVELPVAEIAKLPAVSAESSGSVPTSSVK
jgi:VWFA-related protein